MRTASQPGGRLDQEHGADDGQGDGHYRSGMGFQQTGESRLAPLGPRPPDEGG